MRNTKYIIDIQWGQTGEVKKGEKIKILFWFYLFARLQGIWIKLLLIISFCCILIILALVLVTEVFN